MEENNNQNNDNNQNDNSRKSPNRGFMFMLIVSVGLTLLFFYAYSRYQNSQKEEISYSEFLTMLDEGKVAEVKVYSSTVEVIAKKEEDTDKKNPASDSGKTEQKEQESQKASEEDGRSGISVRDEGKHYYATRISDINLVDRLEAAKEKGELDYTAVDESGSAMIWNILSWVVMFGLFYLIIWLFMRSMSKGGGMMGVGKSTAKMYMEKETGVTFADVAGQEESKESLKEMVDFLHNPAKYRETGEGGLAKHYNDVKD